MNLGGYSRENFNESTGNRILENFLHSNSLIFTHFSQQDKTPNFDGYFEILKQATGKNIPIGRYEVQIKTMDHNYINTNKQKNCSQYKYSCETKIFNAVKNAITLNPCYLFMVDVNKKRIFAKYISLEFVLSLNLKDEKNKTIYFNDTDEIKNVNYFYEVTKKVYLKKSKELNNIEKNELIVTNNLTCSEMSELQRELDYLNNVFDTELSFVKSKLFPQIWKFGLAYLKDKNSVGIGIYYICKGKNGQYFKRLDSDSYKDCMYVSIRKKQKQNMHEIINNFIKTILETIYKYNILPLKYVNDEVLYEIAYYFLDKIASIEKIYENTNKPCVYYKDIEKVQILESYLYALEQYGYDKSRNKINLPSPNINYYIISDPMRDICYGNNFETNLKHLCYLLKHSTEIKQKHSNIILQGDFEYSLIKEAIIELKNRNIDEVHRIWKSKNLLENATRKNLKGIYRIENGYELSDYFDNLQKLIISLPTSYDYFIKHFGNLSDALKVRKKYIYAFSNNYEYKVVNIIFNNESFVTEIDNSILSILEQKNDLFKIKNVISITSSLSPFVFNIHFPMLTYINYLFVNQLSNKYNINKLRLEDRDIIV